MGPDRCGGEAGLPPTGQGKHRRSWPRPLIQCAPEARCVVEIETAGVENITLATIAPQMHPRVWIGKYAAASRHLSRRRLHRRRRRSD
jgi:hypothetical protein